MREERHLYRVLIAAAQGLLPLAAGMSLALPHAASAQVTEAWVARYNGPGTYQDVAYDVAVDGQGGVHVTGPSAGPSNPSPPYDYATIKYTASGLEEWVARYDGPGGSEDDSLALALGADGSVHVTGQSTPFSYLLWDVATIRYSAAGVEDWVERYEGPGQQNDVGEAIAMDMDGNVFVAGMSEAGIPAQNNGFRDFLLLKYSSTGALLWERRYNGPANGSDWAYALAVDGSGNAYITGPSYGTNTGQDFATQKYASDGTLRWTKRYTSNGNNSDVARAIGLDAAGNVYVTGSRGSSQGSDYVTIKYSSAGSQVWVKTYNGVPRGNDDAQAVAVDAAGNVTVTGQSQGTAGLDYATVKYSTSGTQLWVGRYNGPGNGEDSARDIALDGSGNAYLTGWSVGAGTSFDVATLKYGPSGILLWQARYNTPEGGSDRGHAIALDQAGNVYVAGEGGPYPNTDFVTIKYLQQ